MSGPGEYALEGKALVLRCAECGASCDIRDVKYVGGVAQVDHKTDCSQVFMARPFLYSQLQANNPSVGSNG